MVQDLSIGPPADENEIHAFAEILIQSLGFPPLSDGDWTTREGHKNMRLARRRGKVVGGLVAWRMGQWFGGRSVPMTGVRAVAVAPEHRATGVCAALMQNVLEEIHRDEVPLSVLYPATQPIYRRCGYEQAGSWNTYRLPMDAFEVRDRNLNIRPAEESDRDTILRLYQERARRTSGNLDRGDRIWRRVFDPLRKNVRGYLVSRGEQPEGYVFFSQEAGTFVRYDLLVNDLVALTPDAGRRILTFFAEHRSMAEHVSWCGPPHDPMFLLLPEQKVEITQRMLWLLRIVDVHGALEARGYPPGVQATIHLQVRDEVLPHNDGRFVLEVSDSAARVRPGGEGRLRIDVRGLAGMYTGFLSPIDLRTCGYADGDESDLLTAATVFAGPSPWLAEIF